MHRKLTSLLAALSLGISFASKSQGAPTIWDGPLITFTKPAFADWTLPQFQDQITDLVSITRADDHGIFNAETESLYARNISPAGTEWASGTTDNFASLTYRSWEQWARSVGNPPSTVGKDAVVHLIAEDIYLDLKFTSWGGPGGGGEFTYTRSTIPEPGSVWLLSFAGLVALSRRRR